jgi:hypothetical protein
MTAMAMTGINNINIVVVSSPVADVSFEIKGRVASEDRSIVILSPSYLKQCPV